jgi:hypothetical protein
MAKRAKASEPSEPSEPEREAGIVKVDEPPPLGETPVEVEATSEAPPALPAAPNGASKAMSVSEPPSQPPNSPPRPHVVTPSGPSFGQRVGGFFRFLLRLVFLLILLSLLSLALYLTLPWLYQKFITPVEQNTARVKELQSRQAQTEQQLADLQTKLGTLETVQNGHDGSLTELDKRLSDIETEITARSKSLQELEDLQARLQEQNEANAAELERQINLLKGMELLSRARLFMYESNFGLASQDVQIARDLLAKIQPDAPRPLTDELKVVVERLDMTLANLPDFPIAASDDLDIAWQILLSGLPQATPTVIMTLTPAGTLSVTPTGSATEVTLTPTSQVTATVQSSVTP